ncbi:MAG: phosphate/phosphite/phosphonate ABC transporter substrate-binding protein [Actinobacteria bacterium]|nr:phosphate/phosphite/phosphonate ABC transporter substrate-binding protein [Actinomycetota bacterium]
MRARRLAVAFAAPVLSATALVAMSAVSATAAKNVNVCPSGSVNFGVEPYDAGAKFTGAYQALTDVLSKDLNCPVNLIVTDNYTNEIEAMKSGKIDVGEFGPLGYIFAHTIANAQPVAVFATAQRKPVTYTAGLWVPVDSTIKTVADLKGHTIAFSDPGSTSGNLLPRYALIKAGLNPDKDVKIIFAGSHPASLLALTNGKVDAGEVNSQQQATATAAKQFDPSKYREIWKSDPIQNDPITVRGSLSPSFKAAVKKALLKLTPAQLKLVDTELGVDSGPMIPANDAWYDPIRAVVNAEHLQISAIG